MTPKIGIVGTGFGGLAAAIELKKRGFDDIVIFEKGDDVGGVWRENTYPGAACDVPSPFYSFSFEPNPRWPRRFSQQPAILDYIRGIADKYDLRRLIRFGTEVLGAVFDESGGTWTVGLSGGETVTVDVFVCAVGQLSRPLIPDIAGRESFAGPSFHSAQWDHDVDLTGKNVAVIGTGASAIQFVPAITPQVGRLTVFQRSAPYLVPRPDREFSPFHHRVFDKVALTQLGERFTWYSVTEALSLAWVYAKPLAALVRAISKRHMRRGAAGKPGLFEAVWPHYPVGCKRILFSDDYLPALAQPNVAVCTDAITEITGSGVRTAAGTEHPADVLIYGTGFAASDFLAPMSITGLGGRDLHGDEWADGTHAYYGMTVPDFPNLFIMYGPNTNTGGGSIIYFLETQAGYLGDYVEHLAAVRAPLAVRAEVEHDYDRQIQAALGGSVWSSCNSWYRQADGRITANWPKLCIEYRTRAKFDPADYEVVSA